MDPLARARFPSVSMGAAHYESFYIKAADPAGGRALWIRYTVWKAPDQAPAGALWLTLLEDGGPVAGKASGTPSPDADAFIRIEDSTLGAGGARGEIAGKAIWDLTYDGGADCFAHLPASWMYDAPLPRTKAVSLHPMLRFRGSATIGERAIDLDGWLGMLGHNWGSEHPYRGVWMHAAGFDEDPDAYFDAIVGQVALGPLKTPWVGNGCLSFEGARHRLGGISPRATRINARPTGADFLLQGDGIEVHGDVGAPAHRFVAWRYSDPSGGWHPTMHCSISNLTLQVQTRGGATRTLSAKRVASYELQAPDLELPVALQPYPDP